MLISAIEWYPRGLLEVWDPGSCARKFQDPSLFTCYALPSLKALVQMLSEVFQSFQGSLSVIAAQRCCEHNDMRETSGNLLAQFPQMTLNQGKKIRITQKKKGNLIKMKGMKEIFGQWKWVDVFRWFMKNWLKKKVIDGVATNILMVH